MKKHLKKLGFQEISERISFGYLGDESGEKNLVMCFEPDEGLGGDNPTYLFRVLEIIESSYKKINGKRKRIHLKKNEFYGTFIDETTGEFWGVSNDVKLKIGGYEINCPRYWVYKFKGNLTDKEVKGFMESFEK